MTYLGTSSPAVEPEIDDARFWEAASRRKLVVQRCKTCATLCHPPLPVCGNCSGTDHDWIEAPSQGMIFSFTVTHAAAPGVDRDKVPYNVSLVSFPGLPNIRLITNIMGAEPDELSIGAPVSLVWDDDAHGRPLPRFELKRG